MFTAKEAALLITSQVIIAFIATLTIEFINYDPDRSIGLVGYNKDKVNPKFFKKLKFFMDYILGRER